MLSVFVICFYFSKNLWYWRFMVSKFLSNNYGILYDQDIHIIKTISLILSHGGQANGVWIIISRLKFWVRGVPASPALVFMGLINTLIQPEIGLSTICFAKHFRYKGKIFLVVCVTWIITVITFNLSSHQQSMRNVLYCCQDQRLTRYQI